MVASADMKHIDKFLKIVDQLEDEPRMRDILITFEEFKNYAELRKRLRPLSMAISSFGKANELLTKADFQRAADQVYSHSKHTTIYQKKLLPPSHLFYPRKSIFYSLLLNKLKISKKLYYFSKILT